MTKQPEDWLDDVPGDDIEDEDDEIIWVSKSEIKRDAEELKQLGAEMVELGKNALDKIPLDQDLRDAIELAQNGYDGKQIQEILLREKFESSIYIMVDTLSYLKKGGRITPAAAAIGTVLRIKPVLQIQGEKLDAYAKVKTLKAAKSTMIKAIRHDFEERFHDPDGDNFYMHVAYTADDTEAQAFRKELETEFPGHEVDFVDPLSLSVSCHIGPGALAVAISKKVPELG